MATINTRRSETTGRRAEACVPVFGEKGRVADHRSTGPQSFLVFEKTIKLSIGNCLEGAQKAKGLIEATMSYGHLYLIKACLYQRMWLSSKHGRKGAGSSRKRNNTIYFLLCVRKSIFCPLSLCLRCLHTSKDECGNGDREVLGQSLGAAG